MMASLSNSPVTPDKQMEMYSRWKRERNGKIVGENEGIEWVKRGRRGVGITQLS